jgi:hypothetical protein
MKEYFLKVTEEMGRGLYALYDLPKDRLLFTAELLVLNKEDTLTIDKTDLKWYVFKFNADQDCLVLGDGGIFNHSDYANVSYKLIDYDNRKVMAFITNNDVKQYEQLFINYAADTRVNPENYKVNLIGK